MVGVGRHSCKHGKFVNRSWSTVYTAWLLGNGVQARPFFLLRVYRSSRNSHVRSNETCHEAKMHAPIKADNNPLGLCTSFLRLQLPRLLQRREDVSALCAPLTASRRSKAKKGTPVTPSS